MFMFNEFFFPIMFIKVIGVILVLLVEATLSADQQYEACEPRHCGDSLNVSFPFWIPNQHQSYCGHPGFEITCNEEETAMIQVSNTDYIVRNISYEAYSVLVVHSDAYLNESCAAPLHNISLNDAPFAFGPSYVKLYFFYNCTSTPREYLTYPVPCATNASINHHSFAAFLHQMGLEYLNASSQKCQSMVNTPVHLNEGITSENMVSMKYTDILREGFLLNWGVARNNCTICETSGGRCGFERDEFICFCPNRPHSRSCSKGNNASSRRKKVIALAIGIGGVLATALVFFIWWRKQSTAKSILFWKRSKKAQILVENFLKNYGSLAPKRYNYSDIKKITNSFKDKVGQGGYGLVYKGELLDGRLVAVKLLNKAKGNGEEFINEIGSITRTSHVNVVSLLGFCFEGSKRALIYEFMPNGSLEKFIYDPNPLEAQSQLGWEMLYQITIGVARGLEYLHRGCNTRILHFDIKPHNILLDHDFTPKISDFGLAKLCPNKESVISMMDARGTAGYIAPEVFNRNFGGVSHKSDVYSYGMMVLEIAGRRKNINVQVDHTSEIYFPQWIYKRLIQFEDLELYGVTSQDEIEMAKKMILVALWCIQTNPVDRPSMSRVVEMFEGRNELLQIPPKPYLCSPPRSRVRTSNT